MAVRLAAVKKCAVPGAQGAGGAIIFQGAAAALYHEEQVGGQPLTGASMGAARLQPANLLQMHKIRPRKGGGCINNALGMHQLAVK